MNLNPQFSQVLSSFGGDGERIITFEAPQDGVSVLIIGGIHGNEKTGIAVVHLLLKDLEGDSLSLASGSVTLALGNPRAIAAGTRTVSGEPDLNRLFTPDILEKEGSDQTLRRAQVLARYIADADITIDIHSANKPTEPFVISRAGAKYERIYRWFDKSAVLVDPDYVFWGGVATTEEYADCKGNIGVGIETGHVDETGKIPSVLESIRSMLIDQKIIRGTTDKKSSDAPLFTLTEQIIYEDGFVFADENAIRNFSSFKKGETFAFHNGEPISVEYDCVVVFPKTEALREVGNPVCWLAKKPPIEEFSLLVGK